jgi:hypothetical protein
MLSTFQPDRSLMSSSNHSRKVLGVFGRNDVGNTIDTAKNARLLKQGSGVFKHSGDVGGQDLDFFKFKIDTSTVFTARLQNKSRKNDRDPIALSIVNGDNLMLNGADGKPLSRGSISAGTTDTISTTLNPGVYYIRLESVKGTDQNYKLRLATGALPSTP